MKKLVFTALAVVAFSCAAMAKTAEVKEEVISDCNNVVQNDTKNVAAADCVEVANALIRLHEVTDFWGYVGTWLIIYSNCQESQQ